MIELTMDNFQKEVLENNIPVFVDFYANWCGPCKMMAPVVEELEADYDGKVKFAKCDIDENIALAQQYRIMSIPTFVIFVNGKPQDIIVGGQAKSSLDQKIKSLL